jgi:hypothetical protein
VEVKLILDGDTEATVENTAITGENQEKLGVKKGAGKLGADVY